jgi:hypothetical protein
MTRTLGHWDGGVGSYKVHGGDFVGQGIQLKDFAQRQLNNVIVGEARRVDEVDRGEAELDPCRQRFWGAGRRGSCCDGLHCESESW